MSIIADTLSTLTPLLENQIFISPITDLEGFIEVSIGCNFTTDTASNLDLIVEFSIDGINFDHIDHLPITNDLTLLKNITIKSRFCRISLLNGVIPMNTLRLETIVYKNPKTIDVVLDGTSSITLANGTNNTRINGILHNGQVITSNTYTTAIDLKASGSEMYNSITVSGKSPELYNMVLEYSNDDTMYFTDHIEPDVKQLGNNATFQFSLTRNSINHRYVRVYHLFGSSSLDLVYSITRI
jgi:hypothetical protein